MPYRLKKNKRKADQGSALITALFIMTLVAIAATAMSLRLQIEIRRTQTALNADKILMQAQKPLYQAMLLLAQNQKRSTKGKLIIEPKESLIMNEEKDGFHITATLVDLQSRYNINKVADKRFINPFIQLLKNSSPKLHQEQARKIAFATTSWLKPINLSLGKTALDKYYDKQKPPYQQAHQLMQSISEFRLVKNVNARIFLNTSPYLTALPDVQTPVNINTAPLTVLKTLSPGLNDEQAKSIIKKRGKAGFTSLQAIQKASIIKKLALSNKEYTLQSNYFLLISQIRHGSHQVIIFDKLQRIIKRKKVRVNLLERTLNTL